MNKAANDKFLNKKYEYHGMDITLDVREKIAAVIRLLAKAEDLSFESAYTAFAESDLYEALLDPRTLYWAESAGYLLEEYYRRQK